MKLSRISAGVLAFALATPAAAANDAFTVNGVPLFAQAPGGYLPAVAAYFPNGLGTAAAPLAAADVFQNPNAITPSDSATFTPGKFGIAIIVTVPGHVKVGFANGVTWTVPLTTTGYFQFPWGVNQIFVTGTTATATYAALN